MINIYVLDVSYGEVDNFYIFVLVFFLFYVGFKIDLKLIWGFLEYGLLFVVGGVVICMIIFGIVIFWLSLLIGMGIVFGIIEIMLLGVVFLIVVCFGFIDVGVILSVLCKV